VRPGRELGCHQTRRARALGPAWSLFIAVTPSDLSDAGGVLTGRFVRTGVPGGAGRQSVAAGLAHGCRRRVGKPSGHQLAVLAARKSDWAHDTRGAADLAVRRGIMRAGGAVKWDGCRGGRDLWI
jgi:hypothetical protein